MVKRKLEASNDIYQTFIAHSIDTPEKFEAERAELAEREWARMKKTTRQPAAPAITRCDGSCEAAS